MSLQTPHTNWLKAIVRKNFWQSKLKQDIRVLGDWIDILDPLANHFYISQDLYTDDQVTKKLKTMMRGYFMGKFVAAADVVYRTLVLRLHHTAWDKQKFDNVYYPAVSFSILLPIWRIRIRSG